MNDANEKDWLLLALFAVAVGLFLAVMAFGGVC